MKEYTDRIGTREMVDIVLIDIMEEYKDGTKSEAEAKLDAFRLSTARMLHEVSTSENRTIASIATKYGLVGDWEPMLDFVIHEHHAAEEIYGPGKVPWFENLRKSLKVVHSK